MSAWTNGNNLDLLENGEEFFPAIFKAIEEAKHEILIETFIWKEDSTGFELCELLAAAARRGVRAHVSVDGFGTPGFSSEFLAKLTGAGVIVDAYDPQQWALWVRTNLLCRLHRKLVVVDGETAFIGGINFSDVHLRSFGGQSMQDYAVQLRGPIVKTIREFCVAAARNEKPSPRMRRRKWLKRLPKEYLKPGDDAQALFVTRDNALHRNDIELVYRHGIRHARHSILLANAYFFPGFRFVRQLCRAAKRGVDVVLIMQGKPDRPLTNEATSIIYADLLAAGVRICRYEERPLHAKVAVIDDMWATVGTSNLDPVSLGLNLEANLFVRDAEFSKALRRSLETLIHESCEYVAPDSNLHKSFIRRVVLAVVYHLTLRMHSWGARFRSRRQRLKPMEPGTTSQLIEA